MDIAHSGPSSIISKLQAIEDKISGNRFRGLRTIKKKRETKVQKIHRDYVLLTSSDEEDNDTTGHSMVVRKRKLPSSNYADDSDYEPTCRTYQAYKDDSGPKRGRGRPKKLKIDTKIDREKDHSLLQLTKVLSRAELRHQNDIRDMNSGESCDSDKSKIKRGRGRPRKIDISAIKLEDVSSSSSCVRSQDAMESVSGIFELSAEMEAEHLLKEAELSSNALQALAFVYQDENKSFSDAAELGLSFGDTPFNPASILTPPPSTHTTPDKLGSFSHYSFNYAVSNSTKDSSNSFASQSKDKSISFKYLSKKQPNAFKRTTFSLTKDPKEEKPHVNSVHCMKTRRSSVITNIESHIRTSPRKDKSSEKRNLKATSKPLKLLSSVTIEKSKRKLFPIKVLSNKDKPVTSYAHLIGSRQYAETSIKTCFNLGEIEKPDTDENRKTVHPIKEETEPFHSEQAAKEQSPVENIPIKDEEAELKTERLTDVKPIEMNSFLLTVIKDEAIVNSDSIEHSDSVKVSPENIQESEVGTLSDSSALTELPDSNCIKTESNELIPSNSNISFRSKQPSPIHCSNKPLASSPGQSPSNKPPFSNVTSTSNSKKLVENIKAIKKSNFKRALQNRNSKKPTRARGGYRASSHPTLPDSPPVKRQFQVTPDSWYTCEKCGTIFKFVSTYNYHVATDCNTKAVAVRAAEAVQESSEVFQCPQCPKQVASRTSLMVHLRQHTGERPFQCDLCPVAFYQKHHLRDHKDKIHENPKSFVCRHCGETSLGFQAWKGHMGLCEARHQKVDTLPCRLCGARFKTKEELDEHAPSHLGQEKPFPCPSCPRRFHSPSQLARHTPSCPLASSPSPHTCPLCGKVLASGRHLRAHQARHEGAGALGHPCAHCPARFYSSYELRMHTRLHTDERPYPCPVCLKRFRRKSTMELHHTLHTGVKPYACTECDQKFNRNVKLQIHYTQAHNKGSIFQCFHCSKTFPCKTYLIPHLRAHTGQKPYACLLCARSFTRSYQLRNHLKRNHQRSEQNPYARAFVSVGETDSIAGKYEVETDGVEGNAIQDIDEDATSVHEFRGVQEYDENSCVQEIYEENSCVQEIDEENSCVKEIDEDTKSVHEFRGVQEYDETSCVQEIDEDATSVHEFNAEQEIYEEKSSVQEIDKDTTSVHEFNPVQEIDEEKSLEQNTNRVIVLSMEQETNYVESNEDTTSDYTFNAIQENNEENSCVQETNRVIVFNVDQETNYVESNEDQDMNEDTTSVHAFNAVQKNDEESSSVIVFNLVQETSYGESNRFQDIHNGTRNMNNVHNFNGILQVSNAQDRLQKTDELPNGQQEIKDHETNEQQRFCDEPEILPD